MKFILSSWPHLISFPCHGIYRAFLQLIGLEIFCRIITFLVVTLVATLLINYVIFCDEKWSVCLQRKEGEIQNFAWELSKPEHQRETLMNTLVKWSKLLKWDFNLLSFTKWWICWWYIVELNHKCGNSLQIFEMVLNICFTSCTVCRVCALLPATKVHRVPCVSGSKDDTTPSIQSLPVTNKLKLQIRPQIPIASPHIPRFHLRNLSPFSLSDVLRNLSPFSLPDVLRDLEETFKITVDIIPLE